jgi:adenine-specific DNA-methyltransferase
VATSGSKKRTSTTAVAPRNSQSPFECISGDPAAQNAVIQADNLSALPHLHSLWNGNRGIDVIYIDPPYNVGGTTEYRNEWKGEASSERLRWAGPHGSFLEFIEPRLRAARELMCRDGICFVSICDQEYAHLKILMDEIFGPENCLGTIVWNKNQGAAGSHLTVVHEYILAYAREAAMAPPLKREKQGVQLMLQKAAELKRSQVSYEQAQHEYKKWVASSLAKGLIGTGEAPYNMLHPKTFRPFQATPSCAHDKPETRCRLALKHPVTKRSCKIPAKGWKWSEPTLRKMAEFSEVVIGDGFVIAGSLCYGQDETTVPRKLQYLDEKMFQSFPSVLTLGYGGQRDLPDGVSFSTPKPVDLIMQLLKTFPQPDALVLDFFAGSGATAQAVARLNEADGGKRRWILIEEMGSTIRKVLIPRLKSTKGTSSFGVFLFEDRAGANAVLSSKRRRVGTSRGDAA